MNKQPNYLTQIQILKSGGTLTWETQSEWSTRDQAEAAARIHSDMGEPARVVDDVDELGCA